MSDLFWLADVQMERVRPFFPQGQGKLRVNDRRMLSGIVFVNRDGLRWRDAPGEYVPHNPALRLSKGRFTIGGSVGARRACLRG